MSDCDCDDFDNETLDNETLDAVELQMEIYWADYNEAERPAHHNSDSHKWTVDWADLMVASWEIARLLFGPDDESIIRDAVECSIQEALKISFDRTEGDRIQEVFYPPFGRANERRES